MIKGEHTDLQLAFNPLEHAVGVLLGECAGEFRREWGVRKEEEGWLQGLPGGERRVFALNRFSFLWFINRAFFFHLHNHYFKSLMILLEAFTFKSTENRDNPVTDLLKMFLWCVFMNRYRNGAIRNNE